MYFLPNPESQNKLEYCNWTWSYNSQKCSLCKTQAENALKSGTAIPLVWHRTCYAHFTEKSKIEHLHQTQTEHLSEEAGCTTEVVAGNRRSSRKGAQPVNWSLCQSPNKKVRLSSVMTKQMSDQIIQASHLDYKVGLQLAGVIDLIAAEAKYHLPCLSAFNRSTSKTKQESANTDLAMIWLCHELQQAAERGNVILLDTVRKRYKELADESSTMIQPSYQCRRGTSKEKLQSQLGDTFNFFQLLDRCITEWKTVSIPASSSYADGRRDTEGRGRFG